MNAIDYKNKSNNYNAEHCKTILCMIDEAASMGEYKVEMSKDMFPENKMKFIQSLGFQIGYNGNGKYTIAW